MRKRNSRVKAADNIVRNQLGGGASRGSLASRKAGLL